MSVEPADERRLLHRSLIEARRGLCDALDALAEQREGLVIVGSHAVHERTKHLGIDSTQTKDSDLAVVPTLFAAEPRIEEAMRAAGFRPLSEFTSDPHHERFVNQPGLWGRGFDQSGAPIAEVDFIVPAAMSGGGRRAPRVMSAHGRTATRMAPGLELVAVDRDLLAIESFDDGIVRDAYVAGNAALVCAKAFKLGERVTARDRGRGDRVNAKDAGDLWRIMAASDPRVVARTFTAAGARADTAGVVGEALRHLRSLDGSGELLDLASIDLAGVVDDDDIDATYRQWWGSFVAG